MKIVLRIAALITIATLTLNAQVDSVYTGKQQPGMKKEQKDPRFEKLKKAMTWGGDFQAWIGNSTFILLSPTIGFIPYKNLNAAIGIVYNYTSYSSSRYGRYSQSIFGGHSLLRYTIGESYFVQVQFDKLRQPNLFSSDPNDKIWVDYLLVGGGFRQNMGDKIALITSIMYNVHPDPLSIYFSGIIVQFGITGRF
jgi:hypothetical protein